MDKNTPIWQIREDLSYTNLDLGNADRERYLVKQIISKKQVNWVNLNLEFEAKIQRLLRQQGYEILCYGLDIFPTSTAELLPYLQRLSLQQVLKIKAQLLWFNLKHIELTGIIAFILLVGGLFYFWNPILLLYALVLAYFICNCLLIMVHEGWAHDYIKPKNRVIGFLLDLFSYFYYIVKSRIGWKYRHGRHHQYWKQDDDWDQEGMNNTPYWAYLLFGVVFRRKYPKPRDHEDFEFQQQYLTQTELYKNQLLPESRWLDKYNMPVKISLHVVFIILLGFEKYFYFAYLQCWLFLWYFRTFSELIPHKNELSRDQDKDSPILFPICTGVAYHVSHHRHGGYIIFGTNTQRRYNIQYYFVRLFYNIKAKVYTF